MRRPWPEKGKRDGAVAIDLRKEMDARCVTYPGTIGRVINIRRNIGWRDGISFVSQKSKVD
jgi:hypothetical protein